MKSTIQRFIDWLDNKYPTGEPDAQMRAFGRDYYLSGYVYVGGCYGWAKKR